MDSGYLRMDYLASVCMLLTRKFLLASALLLAGWAAGPADASAQASSPVELVRVSGTVSDASTKQPLPGVTVQLQRTRRGVATDAQGDFLLSARATDTLVVRALGYKPKQVVLPGTALAQLVVQVRLLRDSVRLGEVRVTADRLDRTSLNRALRNLRRPAPAVVKGPQRPPRPVPLFPVDSTPPPPPPFGNTPFDWAYAKWSREGKERRKVQQLKTRDAQQQAQRRKAAYNKAFKDNRGYE